MAGGDDGGKKPLPLFELGKGSSRPGRSGGLKPLPRAELPPPEPDPPPAAPAERFSATPRTPAHGVPPLSAPTAAPPSAGRFGPVPRTPAHGLSPPPVGSPAVIGRVVPPPRSPPHGVAAPRTPAYGSPPLGGFGAPPRTPAQGVVPIPAGGSGAQARYPFDAGAPSEARKHPLSGDVAQWLQSFLRAIRGRRIYPANNPLVRQYLDQAYQGIFALHQPIDTVLLRVREDRLFFEGDVVLLEPDRMEGLPFLLFSNSIQQLELKRGLTIEELHTLIEQLSRDFGSDEHVGEDLVTGLWRSNLPHVDYLVIDVYNLENAGHSDLDPSAVLMDEESRRLRDELAAIVESMKAAGLSSPEGQDGLLTSADPLVAEVNVVDEDPSINEWDVPQLVAAAHLEADVRDLGWELRDNDEHDALTGRLTELLVSALRAEDEAAEETPGWRLLLSLLDAVLRGRQFAEAQRLAIRLGSHLSSQPRVEDRILATRLLQYLGSPGPVQLTLQILDITADPAVTKAGLEFLDYLGVHAYQALLAQAGTMQQPQARRQVVELIGKYVREDPNSVAPVLAHAPPELIRDLLGLGETLPAHVASDLVWVGSEHVDASVRSRAVALLRGFGGRDADQMVARFIQDRDASVRAAALGAASHRKSQQVLDALLAVLRRKDLDDVESGELKLVLSALVAVGGAKSTPVLARLLTQSGALGIRRYGTDVQVAVAHALGLLGTPEARAALEAGTKTINRKVKHACKLALAARTGGALHLDLPARFGELGPRPAQAVRERAPVPMAPPRTPIATALEGRPPAVPSQAEQGQLHGIPAPPPAIQAPWIPAPPPPAAAPSEPSEPPPLLDPSALRFASDITQPERPSPSGPTEPSASSDLEATVPAVPKYEDAVFDDGHALLEAPTISDAGAAAGIPPVRVLSPEDASTEPPNWPTPVAPSGHTDPSGEAPTEAPWLTPVAPSGHTDPSVEVPPEAPWLTSGPPLTPSHPPPLADDLLQDPSPASPPPEPTATIADEPKREAPPRLATSALQEIVTEPPEDDG